MSSPAEAIATYIAAKDGNRPWLMQRAFAADAILEMEVRTDAVSFPPLALGLEAITDTLVRRFARDYENVYTFCLTQPPAPNVVNFSCGWLVGMSLPNSRELRIGCGRYDWDFTPGSPHLVKRLKIIIATMQILPAGDLLPTMGWLGALPYPWCPAELVIASAPALQGVNIIFDAIVRR